MWRQMRNPRGCYLQGTSPGIEIKYAVDVKDVCEQQNGVVALLELFIRAVKVVQEVEELSSTSSNVRFSGEIIFPGIDVFSLNQEQTCILVTAVQLVLSE